MKKILEKIGFYRILDILCSEAGSEDARKIIKNIEPSSNIETVEKLINQTAEAHTISLKFGSPDFCGLKPVKDIIKKAVKGGMLSNAEFLAIYSSLKTIRKIKDWSKNSLENANLISVIFEKILPNSYLEKKISSIILSESEVSDNASEVLFGIRQKIKNLNLQIREKLEKFINSQTYRKMLMEPIITIRDSRFVIPVKAEYRTEIRGIVHDISAKGATLFIEPLAVVDINNQINELKKKEFEEIEKILTLLSKEIAGFDESIMKSYNATVEADIIFAKANMAIKMKATLPKINNQGIINLKKARHPLIPQNEVVPVDIRIGENFDVLVITGPNTGGKTVALKTLGLTCAMAMSGMMISAGDNSSISVFDEILVDIGDDQSIEQSLSTFSSHMKNIVKIIDRASNKTLILLDEIGSGTDPEEGACLSIAILDKLREKKSKIVVTTHYTQLKEYAISNKRVECASCEFDQESLKPTYRILIGEIGCSNAFLISKKLGLGEDIIKRAKEILGDDKLKLNNFLSRIEKVRQELENEKSDITKLYNETKLENEKVRIEKDKLNKERDKILEEARNKAKNIVDSAKIDIEHMLKKLDRFKKNGEFISANERRNINSKLSELENLVDPIEEESFIKDKEVKFKDGDMVFVSGFEKEGIVCSDEDKNGNYKVIIGKIKTTIRKDKLRPSKNKKNDIFKNSGTNFNKNVYKRKIITSIDIRGHNALEAIQELEIFLDNSFICSLKEVSIIHGNGTGILRSAVHDFLKKNKHVKSFRIGEFSEGGTGVTVVFLK